MKFVVLVIFAKKMASHTVEETAQIFVGMLESDQDEVMARNLLMESIQTHGFEVCNTTRWNVLAYIGRYAGQTKWMETLHCILESAHQADYALNPNISDDVGATILWYMYYHSNMRGVKYLQTFFGEHLNWEISPMHGGRCNGMTPLLVVCSRGEALLMHEAVRARANLYAHTPDGDTALHLAAMAGSIYTFRVMRHELTVMNPENPHTGTTPFELAILHKRYRLIEYMYSMFLERDEKVDYLTLQYRLQQRLPSTMETKELCMLLQAMMLGKERVIKAWMRRNVD